MIKYIAYNQITENQVTNPLLPTFIQKNITFRQMKRCDAISIIEKSRFTKISMTYRFWQNSPDRRLSKKSSHL